MLSALLILLWQTNTTWLSIKLIDSRPLNAWAICITTNRFLLITALMKQPLWSLWQDEMSGDQSYFQRGKGNVSFVVALLYWEPPLRERSVSSPLLHPHYLPFTFHTDGHFYTITLWRGEGDGWVCYAWAGSSTKVCLPSTLFAADAWYCRTGRLLIKALVSFKGETNPYCLPLHILFEDIFCIRGDLRRPSCAKLSMCTY